MVHRLAAYVLIFAVAALSAQGVGWWPPSANQVASLSESALAAPLGGDNAIDNGSDNSDLDNDSDDSDNGSDNSDECDEDSDNGDCESNNSEGNDDNSDDDSNDNTEVIELETTVTVTAAAPPPPPAPPVVTQPPSFGGPGNCQYVLGFADLHRTLNGRPGACLENEHPDPNGTADQIQATAFPPPNGLMVWNARTNTMRWTDGFKTWTYSKCLLQERLNTQTWRWELDPSLMLGPDPNPPPGACSLV